VFFFFCCLYRFIIRSHQFKETNRAVEKPVINICLLFIDYQKQK